MQFANISEERLNNEDLGGSCAKVHCTVRVHCVSVSLIRTSEYSRVIQMRAVERGLTVLVFTHTLSK